MTATINTLTFQKIQASAAMSLGRSICTADRLEMTRFIDCHRNDFWWDDGGCFSMVHDTREDAVEQARMAGFRA